jgi:hypothetical protein
MRGLSAARVHYKMGGWHAGKVSSCNGGKPSGDHQVGANHDRQLSGPGIPKRWDVSDAKWPSTYSGVWWTGGQANQASARERYNGRGHKDALDTAFRDIRAPLLYLPRFLPCLYSAPLVRAASPLVTPPHSRYPRFCCVPSVFFGASNAALAKPGDTKTFVILHTNDQHGHLLPFSYPDRVSPGDDVAQMPVRKDIGGIARRATLVKQIRAREKNVLLFDGGDCMDGTPFSTEFLGKADYDAMNGVGYDFAVPGNHDFNMTARQFQDLIGLVKFPYLVANLTRRMAATISGRCRRIRSSSGRFARCRAGPDLVFGPHLQGRGRGIPDARSH